MSGGNLDDIKWAVEGLSQYDVLARRFQIRNLEVDNSNFSNLKLSIDALPEEFMLTFVTAEVRFCRVYGRQWRRTIDNHGTRWSLIDCEDKPRGFIRFTGPIGRMEMSATLYLAPSPTLLRLVDDPDWPKATLIFNQLIDQATDNWVV